MSDEIVKLQPRAKRKDQAADWLAKLDRGDLSSDERVRFERWLVEDPKNKEEIKAAASFWYGLNAPLSQYVRDIENSRAPAHAEIKISLLPAFAALVARWLRILAPTGAVTAVAVFAFMNYERAGSLNATGYYSTAIGETREIAFGDGSNATLNTNSILEQDFSRKERVIRLVSGEAMFDVAHDEARPFIVYAADGVVRAVGTRFVVRVEPDNVSVTVTEGRVELQRRLAQLDQDDGTPPDVAPQTPEAPVMIGQGEAGEISRIDGASKQAVTEHDLAERLSWANGQLVFYDRELQSVVEEVSRYTPVSILIEDEALKKRKITGVVQIGEVDEMLDAIEGALGVTAQRVSPEVIYLSAG